MPHRLLIRVLAVLLVGLLVSGGEARGAPDAGDAPKVVHYLPFPVGATYKVWQGNDQKPSHDDKWNRYAFDFSPMKLGATICATADGVVTYVKEDTAGATGNWRDNNEVAIRHADGTVGTYLHLQKDGGLVEVGDVVYAGDPIGKGGNTGSSTDVHLHFGLRQGKRLGPSVPCRFADVPGGGVPKKGDHVTSKNLPGRRLEEATGELAALLVLANTYDAREGLQLLFKTLDKGAPPTIEKALAALGRRADFLARWNEERKGILERRSSHAEDLWTRLQGARESSPTAEAVYLATIGRKEFSGLPRRRDFDVVYKELRKQEGHSTALKEARPRLRARDAVRRALAKDYETLQKEAQGRKVRWKSVLYLYEKALKAVPDIAAADLLRARTRHVRSRAGE